MTDELLNKIADKYCFLKDRNAINYDFKRYLETELDFGFNSERRRLLETIYERIRGQQDEYINNY